MNSASDKRVLVHPNRYEVVLHELDPMAEPPAPDSDVPIADTLGWDTVFAIRLPDVNQALMKPAASPGAFDQDLGGGYSIEGEFGPWQVTMGGDGKNLYLLAPITAGNLHFNHNSTSMAGGMATVIITLSYLPPQPPPAPPTRSGTRHALRAKLTSGGSSEPVASVIHLDFPNGKGPKPGTVDNALMLGALTTWFIDNLARFEHVFSIVDLNLLADEESFQWLKPTTTSYAYADGTDEKNSFFGVLTVTEKRSIADLSHEISPDAIPGNQQSGFLISPELFLENSVLPGLPYAFKDAKASDFQLINHKTEVIKTPGATVALKPILYQGTFYQPDLISISVKILDTEIITAMQVHVEISVGIDVYIDITNYQTLTLVQKADGTQTLGYKATRPMKKTYTKKVAIWVTVTVALAELIVAVVGFFVAGPAAELADVIVVAIITVIIIGVIEGVEIIIEDVITKGVASAMPAFNPMVYAASDPITWPSQQSQFKLTSVALNGALQLGGNLAFGN